MEASGVRTIVHPSKSDVFTLWNVTDCHIGNKATAIERLKADIERIRVDPFAFWVGGGDYAEFISPRDKRWNAADVSNWLTISDLGHLGTKLVDVVEGLFRPIKHKCLGLCFGNHEDKYMIGQEQQDLHKKMCRVLGVPNLGFSSLFDVRFVVNGRTKAPTMRSPSGERGESFRVFIHHGAGSAATHGGKINRLAKFVQDFDADLFFVGHVHDQKGARIVQVTANEDCTELRERVKVGMISGTYLKTYNQGSTTYGEMRGYGPVPLGATCVRIAPATRSITAEI